VAARLFGNDAVLRSSDMSFASALKRPEQPSAVGSLSTAATTLALLFPFYYVTSNALGMFATSDIGVRLVVNAIALIAIFGGLPLLIALFCRNQLKTSYRLAWPRWPALLAGLLLGLGAWTWAHELYLFGEWLGLNTIDETKIAQVRELVASFRQVPPWLVLATLAVTPGVIEELFFRGYLFSALRTQMSPLKTILLSALLFGVFHVLTGKSLLLERFLPTTLLGIMLGWVAWRSGSVWPGILMHVTHNGFLEMVAYFRVDLEEKGIGSAEQSHLPWTWLITGTLLIVVAGLLLQSLRPRATEGTNRGTSLEVGEVG
jgi:ABC-2 type transport system permease protein/sodium transport system permease protein